MATPNAHARQIHTHTSAFPDVRRAAARTSRAVCRAWPRGRRPAAATTAAAVEMLNASKTVAPVPQVSIIALRAGSPSGIRNGMTPHHGSKSRKLREKEWSHVQRSQKAHNHRPYPCGRKAFFHHRLKRWHVKEADPSSAGSTKSVVLAAIWRRPLGSPCALRVNFFVLRMHKSSTDGSVNEDSRVSGQGYFLRATA